MVSPIWSVVAEINEARLVGMECESISCKSLAQYAENPLGIEEVLERHHGIISETGKKIMILRGHRDSVSSAAFSPDDSRIVTASYDKTVCIWDAATGKQITILRGHENIVW